MYGIQALTLYPPGYGVINMFVFKTLLTKRNAITIRDHQFCDVLFHLNFERDLQCIDFWKCTSLITAYA